jgi:AcrR family transcriptional regulator
MEEDADLDEENYVDEGTMTHIKFGKAKINRSGSQEKSVKYKGRNIGTLEKYGLKYGADHPATGGDYAGARSSKEALSALRDMEAEKLMGDRAAKKKKMNEDTLDEQIEAYIEQLVAEGHDEDTIMEAVEHYFGEALSEEAEETDPGFVAEEESYQVDMSEHIEALFAGEELSEEFKEKATAIFEAAVSQKIQEEIAALEEAYAETLEEHIEQIQEELSSNVDDYLNYVVEQWVSENEVAIEAGLRSELTEDFISGLRNLFAEHYIDIPEDKVSVVEEMGSKVSELEEKLNEEIERNVQLTKYLNESKHNEIVAELCEGLTSTQAAKLRSLSEGLEFTSVNEFAQKVNILRENYFADGVNSTNSPLDKAEVVTDGSGMIAEELQGPMAAYVRTLGKKLPN